MLRRCKSISRFINTGKDGFMATEDSQYAVIGSIEMIGWLAKYISPQSRSQLADLNWERICGMRDILIHHFHLEHGWDLEEVWGVASERVPELDSALERFLAQPAITPSSK
jgi:uncharacterized protein with HEPN domain